MICLKTVPSEDMWFEIVYTTYMFSISHPVDSFENKLRDMNGQFLEDGAGMGPV